MAFTCSEPPAEVTHWTRRAVAAATGISLRSVQRIWQEHRLQLHRVRTFKRSADPAFADKVEDLAGLYLDPPLHAVVLSVDEESQIQALECTRPDRPLGPGRPATASTTTSATAPRPGFRRSTCWGGTLIGRRMQRRRRNGFLHLP